MKPILFFAGLLAACEGIAITAGLLLSGLGIMP